MVLGTQRNHRRHELSHTGRISCPFCLAEPVAYARWDTMKKYVSSSHIHMTHIHTQKRTKVTNSLPSHIKTKHPSVDIHSSEVVALRMNLSY